MQYSQIAKFVQKNSKNLLTTLYRGAIIYHNIKTGRKTDMAIRNFEFAYEYYYYYFMS